MPTNKIFTFGDGYATGHIWPEWPQILQALLPTYTVINNAGIGSGPEWLVNRLVSELANMKDSTVVFQWPQANRFDKLIQDEQWKTIANTDPVYYFNHYGSWWLSSQSTQHEVKEYHEKYVQVKQHLNRKFNYEILVQNTLENINCKYLYVSTEQQEKFSQGVKFLSLRQKEVQPSPAVHFDYVIEVILAQLPHLTVDPDRMLELERKINQHTWVAYDPNRDEIWQKMSNI